VKVTDSDHILYTSHKEGI